MPSLSSLAVAAAFGLPHALAAPVLESSSSIQARSEATWEEFKAARTGYQVQLAEPIEDCWSRNATSPPGTDSPMFFTCYDWHSSVHAAYSLYTISEVSGDPRYEAVASKAVRDELVDDEIEFMDTYTWEGISFLDIEVPYGMAWMFNLVEQRKKTTGSDGLRPIADYAASKSREFLLTRPLDYLNRLIKVPAHTNLSWGMVHLFNWAQYTNDEELGLDIQQKYLSIARNLTLDTDCPIEADLNMREGDFFPPCLFRIAAVIQMWDGTSEELKEWVDVRVASDFHIPPLSAIEDRTGHLFAMNFSWAYALWYFYQATGNTAFRDNYVELITFHMSRPDLWNIEAGYLASHFVPQFGVRAIEASKDD